jgi:hypothetical protein
MEIMGRKREEWSEVWPLVARVIAEMLRIAADLRSITGALHAGSVFVWDSCAGRA